MQTLIETPNQNYSRNFANPSVPKMPAGSVLRIQNTATKQFLYQVRGGIKFSPVRTAALGFKNRSLALEYLKFIQLMFEEQSFAVVVTE